MMLWSAVVGGSDLQHQHRRCSSSLELTELLQLPTVCVWLKQSERGLTNIIRPVGLLRLLNLLQRRSRRSPAAAAAAAASQASQQQQLHANVISVSVHAWPRHRE